jgi:hypothetical protein
MSKAPLMSTAAIFRQPSILRNLTGGKDYSAAGSAVSQRLDIDHSPPDGRACSRES